jgi:hypothetical protein
VQGFVLTLRDLKPGLAQVGEDATGPRRQRRLVRAGAGTDAASATTSTASSRAGGWRGSGGGNALRSYTRAKIAAAAPAMPQITIACLIQSGIVPVPRGEGLLDQTYNRPSLTIE